MPPRQKVERHIILYQYPPVRLYVPIANYFYSFWLIIKLVSFAGCLYIWYINDVHVVMIHILIIFSKDYRLLNLHPIFHKYLYWQYKVYTANNYIFFCTFTVFHIELFSCTECLYMYVEGLHVIRIKILIYCLPKYSLLTIFTNIWT